MFLGQTKSTRIKIAMFLFNWGQKKTIRIKIAMFRFNRGQKKSIRIKIAMFLFNRGQNNPAMRTDKYSNAFNCLSGLNDDCSLLKPNILQEKWIQPNTKSLHSFPKTVCRFQTRLTWPSQKICSQKGRNLKRRTKKRASVINTWVLFVEAGPGKQWNSSRDQKDGRWLESQRDQRKAKFALFKLAMTLFTARFCLSHRIITPSWTLFTHVLMKWKWKTKWMSLLSWYMVYCMEEKAVLHNKKLLKLPKFLCFSG